MIFGFGRGASKGKPKVEKEEDEEEELVLFQGAMNGNNPDLSANPRLVQAGLVPTKQMVSDALATRADMIKLDPKGQVVASTVYVDSAPMAPTRLPAQQGLAISQMLKLLAGLDIKVRGKPQAGAIKAEYKGKVYELRINSQPVEGGAERLILRAYDPKALIEKPKELGFSDSLIEKVRALGAEKSGLVLAAGPPFSGLTTLKIGLMRCTDAYQYSIYCLDMFGGRELSYVKMFEALPGDDLTKTMQRALREDADVLTIEPIDDPAKALAALEFSSKAAIISDMHARDSADAIFRLVQMTKKPQLVAEQLKLVVSQMFIRQLCKKCRRAYRPNPTLLKKIGLPPETRVLYRPAVEGTQAKEDEENSDTAAFCETCNGLGYFGKMSLLEVIEMTEGVRKVVLAQGDAKAIRSAARAEKMQSYQSDGLRAVVEGNTSLEELQRAFKA
ncbi:ATPase, T2SS/T4P/T4SS family [Planctomicrobium sp. SH661]|uniref:ATPase, T2SS/T4P/T4SS family n=1 Tax=Planctomicrobium sp. SH661 TaxID=3448124 RepID=UPI003F5BA3A0